MVQRERGRGEQGLMTQGRVGKIAGVTQEKDGPWKVPECYCSYKTAITISVVVKITKKTIISAWSTPIGPL